MHNVYKTKWIRVIGYIDTLSGVARPDHAKASVVGSGYARLVDTGWLR